MNAPPSGAAAAPAPRNWLSLFATAAAVLVAAQASYSLPLRSVVGVWLPSGLVLGLLLRLGRQSWAPVLAGAYLGNTAADFCNVGPVALRFLGPAANVGEAALAALAVQLLAGRGNPIVSLRGVGALVLGGAICANAITAIAGGGLLAAAYADRFANQWLAWWIGDGLGMLVLAPAVLGFGEWRRRLAASAALRKELLEFAGFALLLAAATTLAFDRPGALRPSLAALVFPPLILAALRLGVAAHLLLPGVALLALAFSAGGRGPLVAPDLTALQLEIEVFAFVGIAAVSLLALVATVAEREAAAAQRAQLQTQLHEKQRLEAVGRLTGGIAHDFNNILTVIVNRTEFAAQELPAQHPVQAHLAEIRSAARRSADLTRQLLGFARRQPAAPRDLDLDAAVAGILDMLRRLVGEDLTIVWRPGAGARVRIDPSQLDQILINLCANARDAADGPGHIVLTTTSRELDARDRARHPDCAAGHYVVLTVSDSGRGMDRETLAHAFEPFFTTKPWEHGTGLGLASVNGIVKQNGGFVDIDSTPGVGTTVQVGLPRLGAAVAPSPPAPATNAGPQPPTVGKGETVLVVEDDSAVLALAAAALTRLGYRVLRAAGPTQALAVAAAPGSTIDLLVTDVVMPEMNGRELAAAIAARSPHTRILFTSGYTADVIARHGILDDGIVFLPKPYGPAELAAKVRAVLDTAP